MHIKSVCFLMNDQVSFLNTNESAAIKGLLIILIVIGHNTFFTSMTEPIQLMGYLYCFHIQCFFIIPFLYGSKPLSFRRCSNYFMRLYWPYIIISILLYIGFYVIYEKNIFCISDLLNVLFWGQSKMLSRYCGIQILWFMPAMFSLMIIKDIYYSSHYIVKLILLLISAFFLVISLLSQDWGHYYTVFNNLFPKGLPMALDAAMPFLIWGVICRKIIEFLSSNYVKVRIILCLWVILTILYFLDIIIWERNIWILSSIMSIFPILFVIILYKAKRKLCKLKFLQKFGIGSFQIYIMHPFIGYLLIFILIDFEQYALQYKIGIVLVSTLMMLLSGYLFSIFASKSPFIKRYIFPRSFSEFCGVSNKK